VNSHPKIAFIHDWLVEFGGAEQVLAALLEVWPEAPIYTIVYDPDGPCGQLLAGKRVVTSFIQNFPGAPRRYRSYLAFMPMAIEQLDLRAYDILLSLSYSVAHGVLPQNHQLHINYIHLPARYAWHQFHDYLSYPSFPTGIKSWLARLTLHYLRIWDTAAAQRVDEFVANSRWTAQNVWRYYRRDAQVIYPPVDIGLFEPAAEKKDYYLSVSRLVPYKRVDLIVKAFTAMPEKRLLVIGDGPELSQVRKLAGDNVQFLGYQPAPATAQHMKSARALVYAALEDFGIAPVEAQACGTPVIAYGKAGALETVIDGKTGVLFHEQTVESLIEAVRIFDSGDIAFNPAELRSNAERFAKKRFQQEMQSYIESSWQSFLSAGRTTAPGRS